MAITRTPIVDDDGSGMTGTIINNLWKQELYNQIDAALATMIATTLNVTGRATLSGTYAIASSVAIAIPASVNNWNPAGGAAAIVWRLSPSPSLLITGLVAEAIGTMHLLVNETSNPVNLMNQHANSAAANRFVGPGFVDYALGTWASAWIRYSELGAWVIHKP